MPKRYKIDSFVILGVAVAFQWFFMFTKHDPGLRSVIPFGDDPYDALGSMTTIVNILLCLLLLWRAFRPYRGATPSPAQIQYLRRAQAAIPLSILVTLAADVIAMLRHPNMWIGTAAQNKLFALFAAMITVSVGTLLWICYPERTPISPHSRGIVRSSGFVSALFVFTLAVYPERLIGRLSTHFLTVLIGDLLLFVPVSIFMTLLLPDPEISGRDQANARSNSIYIWAGVMLASTLIGAWLFIAEMNEGGGSIAPVRLRLFVASAYIGLTMAGVAVALAFLRRPLGLGHGRTGQLESSRSSS